MPLALFWAGFHTRRALRKPAFRRWLVGAALLFVALRFGGRLRASELGELYVLLLAPILAMTFGGAVMREEIEDQTLTYSFTRPLSRAWIYAARVAAAMLPVALLILPFLALVAVELDSASAVRLVLAGVASVLAYTGVFSLLGLVFKWSTWLGVAWLLFWEATVSLAPGFIGRLTLNAHLRGLGGLPPARGMMSALWKAPSIEASLVVLLVVAGLTLALGGWLVRRREIVLEK